LNFGTVVASTRDWVHAGGLWAQVPHGGILGALRNSRTHFLETKFGWFRQNPGQVYVTAELLDPGSPSFHSQVGTVPEYGPTGFVPSGLEFARGGCWRVSGILGDDHLAFIVRVTVQRLP